MLASHCLCGWWAIQDDHRQLEVEKVCNQEPKSLINEMVVGGVWKTNNDSSEWVERVRGKK